MSVTVLENATAMFRVVAEPLCDSSAPNVFFIQPQSELPSLTRGHIVIRGDSQQDFTGNTNPFGPEIVLDGLGVHGEGLQLLSSNNVVQGLNIVNFNGNGVLITADQNTVSDSYIGIGPEGSRDRGNRGIGIFIVNATHNTIADNVVSGNDVNGVVIAGALATDNVIRSNLVGTDRTGTYAVGNTLGVHIADAPSNVVEDNIISGNLVGIDVSGQTASGNRVRNNRIGTAIDGLTPLGNSADGIFVDGAPGNLFADNLIAANGFNGIVLGGEDAVGNTIRGNSIHSNGGLGIDLGGDGVTPNDNGDLAAGIDPDEDTGPNTLQNFPEINSVQPGLETRVTGLLRSTPGASVVIDFYANAAADPTGYGEGQRWLGSTQGIVNVIANDEGVAHFKLSLPASTYSGESITATATRLVDDDGNPATPLVLADTSEFSKAFQIKSGKGERGPNTFVLQIPSLTGGIPGEVVNLDVQLVSLANSELAGTEIDVETFMAAIQHPEPGGPPIGLPFKLSARAGAVSPLLLMAAAQGQRLGHVELVGTSTIDGVPFEFARWSLDEALLGSFAELGAQQDQFTLFYDAVDYAFTPLNEMTGTPGTPIVGTWDVSASGGVVVQTFPNLSELPSPVDTFHYYVNIPGIAGDATLENYAGWIEASSFEFGVRGPDFNSATAARATTFNFVAQAGSASPLLLQSVADGDIFSTGTLASESGRSGGISLHMPTPLGKT